jgi:NADPH:quinone reductase-like Zn-dependent oxidoreductase
VKAVRFHAHGSVDVLRYEDVVDPVPLAGDALVRVRACALNHLDLWQRRGIEKVRIPLPHISGSDVAGEVVSAPGGLARAGTRVMLQPGLSCGACGACLSGADNLCARYDVLGYKSSGGYAELVTVPAANLIPIPDTLSFTQAAAFPLTFLTAWHMLVTRARVQAGDWVLVLAAGSGVGQAAVQVARLHGARVLATAGTAAKRQHAQELGAEAALDHYGPALVDEVRAITRGRGVDVVVEHVGEATWERSVRVLARGGRLVTCGATTGPGGHVDLRVLFARQISLLGSYMGSKGELVHLASLLFAGRLTPVIDSVFPLARAAEAQARLESAHQFGKIVLEI